MKWTTLSALALSGLSEAAPQWGENEAQDSLITKLREATADHTVAPDLTALLRGRRNRRRRPNRVVRQGPSLMDVLNVISATSEYGCWCSSKETWSQAHGEPLDEIDTLCKGYVQAMKCVEMELADMGIEDCNVMATRYTTKGIDFFDLINLTYDEIVRKCHAINSDPCAARVCIVDVAMIPGVYSLLKENKEYVIDVHFDHAGSTFNQEEMCISLAHIDADAHLAVAGGDGGDSLGSAPSGASAMSAAVTFEMDPIRPVECCGALPFSKPYKTMGGQRECCVSTPYDSNKFTCCENGEVSISCA